MKSKAVGKNVVRYAGMLAAMGTAPRLRILRLLLAAHPEGMVAGEIQQELGIAASTLSHHLEKLRNEDLVLVRRDRQFLWYTAHTETLRELLEFLLANPLSDLNASSLLFRYFKEKNHETQNVYPGRPVCRVGRATGGVWW